MKRLVNFGLPAFIIALGLFMLGLCQKSGLDNFAHRDRSVAVRGLAERVVNANKVTWPIVYKLVGNSMPELYDEITATNEKIINYLESNGITAKEYSVSAPDIVDMQAEQYNDRPRQYRYNVTSVIVVVSAQVDKVRTLINRQGELLKQGVAIIAGDYQYRVVYDYTKLNEIKPDMIAEATENAREAGEKFAVDSHSRLGKIKNASQGQFSIEDRDPYSPHVKNVRVVTTIDYYLED